MTIQKSVGLTRHVLLDRRVIENALKDRSGRTILADTACKGLRLTIWPTSATYTYADCPSSDNLRTLGA